MTVKKPADPAPLPAAGGAYVLKDGKLIPDPAEQAEAPAAAPSKEA